MRFILFGIFPSACGGFNRRISFSRAAAGLSVTASGGAEGVFSVLAPAPGAGGADAASAGTNASTETDLSGDVVGGDSDDLLPREQPGETDQTNKQQIASRTRFMNISELLVLR